MQSGNDYAELCDFHLRGAINHQRGAINHQRGTDRWSSASTSHIRSNSFEAEDIIEPYGNSSRITNSASSLRASGGRYYSPPGTSYTIVERPHSPQYYPQPNSGAVNSSSAINVSSSRRNINNNNKKRPISPEQVLRLFGTTSSSSAPSNYTNGGVRERGRRSPASSPPSTSHHVNRTLRERERDRSVTNIHELTTRTINMSREQQDTHGFGICIKGGKDAGHGVYISRIEEGSLGERAGLRSGDKILEVNGTPFTTVSHDEALKILKLSRQISMTVRSPPILHTNAPPLHGFGPPFIAPGHQTHCSLTKNGLDSVDQQRDGCYIPYANPTRQTCSWMDRHGRPTSPPTEYGGRKNDRRDRIRNVDLLIEPGQSLGLMIRGGVEYGLGIFITGVDKDSVADRAGLMIGDQILEVNSQSFLDVTHDEAVSQLKYHKRMSLVVRDVGKVPHSCTSEPELWDTYSPNESRNRRKCPISAMVEEKARSLLPRHNFASLSYYINEYGSRGMTIDAFVSVLLEMLDTPEKHTLVTEIRELVFPEDRTRYDELVYSRDPYLSDRERDRHRDQELATKLSRSFDMKEESGNLLGDNMRRHQSMQRLTAEHPNGLTNDPNHEHNPHVVPDHRGNLHISVKKTKPILGIAIEGGANTKHPLPRIINIHEHGAAFETGGLEVGQLILEVDGHKVDGMHHQDVARLIAECFANPDKPDISFLVVEAKKSNLEPKPTALIFLEA